jgi:tetratricopeptide (TPR) repeat protein
MRTFSSVVLIAALSLFPAPFALSADDPQTEEQTAEQAKQARIDEYLKKKEAKKAARKSGKADPEKPAAEKAEKAPKPEKEKKDGDGWFSRRKSRRSESGTQTSSSRRARRSARGTPAAQATGSRDSGQILDRLRNSAIMNDEAGRAHMAIMDRGASPMEMAAFGSYLAQQGYLPASVTLYKSATRADPANPTLWLNLGTAQMRYNQVSEAGQSFQKAIRLDPNNAKAHYNLGAVYARSDYDKAIKEFATALTLDPGLGDPEINPQAANNDLLVPVKMMLYQSQEGSVALPLVPVEGDRAAR